MGLTGHEAGCGRLDASRRCLSDETRQFLWEEVTRKQKTCAVLDSI